MIFRTIAPANRYHIPSPSRCDVHTRGLNGMGPASFKLRVIWTHDNCLLVIWTHDNCLLVKPWGRLRNQRVLFGDFISFFGRYVSVLKGIDYGCEDGRFSVSASCVTISNPDSLSSSETGVNPGIWSWKHLPEWARCQKAIGGTYPTNKWRAETLEPGLEFNNLKPWLKCGIFNCISWLNGSFFGGDDRSFLREGVKTYETVPMSLLKSTTIFLFHI